MYISKTMYDQFRKELNDGKYAGQRYGQAFYNHFNMHKHDAGNDATLDKIYEADGTAAKALIAPMIDNDN